MTRSFLKSAVLALCLGCSAPSVQYRHTPELTVPRPVRAGIESVPYSFCASSAEDLDSLLTTARLLEEYGVQTKPAPCAEYTASAVLDEKYHLTLTLSFGSSCSPTSYDNGSYSLEMFVDSFVKNARAVLVIPDVFHDPEPRFFFLRNSAFGDYRVPVQDEAAVQKILESACVLTRTLQAEYRRNPDLD